VQAADRDVVDGPEGELRPDAGHPRGSARAWNWPAAAAWLALLLGCAACGTRTRGLQAQLAHVREQCAALQAAERQVQHQLLDLQDGLRALQGDANASLVAPVVPPLPSCANCAGVARAEVESALSTYAADKTVRAASRAGGPLSVALRCTALRCTFTRRRSTKRGSSLCPAGSTAPARANLAAINSLKSGYLLC
jgi:hypothetical protein